MNDDWKFGKEEILRQTFFDLVFFCSELKDYWMNGVLKKDADHDKDFEEFTVVMNNFTVDIHSRLDKNRNVVRVFKNGFKKPIKTQVFTIEQIDEARQFIMEVING